REVFHLLRWIEAEGVEELAGVSRIPRAVKRLCIPHQLVDPHPLRQLAILGEVADAAEHLDRMTNRVETEHTHRAALRAQQAEQMLDQRRLAGAVRADKAVHLTGRCKK